MTQLTNKIPQLFANCILVRGATRSLICDVQRLTFHFIPDALSTILTKQKGKPIDAIKLYFKNEYDAFIDEYFDFLVKQELVFFTNTPSNYPKLDLKWEEPFLITNAIIDTDNISDFDIPSVFTELDAIFCKNVQIRCFTQKGIEYFDTLLTHLSSKRITNIEILTHFDDSFTEVALEELCQKHKRLSILTLYASAENKQIQFRTNTFGHVFFTQQMIDSKQHCGAILSEYFTINIKTFTEAQKHNTCLNRKISIDTEGYIRNCPSMPEHYGNIKDTTLAQALEHPDFK
jgi:SPASM domain peptide maturase of grasp-with-spasm system